MRELYEYPGYQGSLAVRLNTLPRMLRQVHHVYLGPYGVHSAIVAHIPRLDEIQVQVLVNASTFPIVVSVLPGHD